MPLGERGPAVMDRVVAELVDCIVPAPPPVPDPPVVAPPPDATPTEQSAEATIEQTGSGPPPDGPV